MPLDILKFWFEQATPEQWFKKDAAFDRTIRERFTETHRRAACCELFAWRATPQGRLAEIIVLDQLSRNMYRDSPQAFAQDALALALAQEAVARGADQALSPIERNFLYMPYMHSESALIHQQAVPLFENNGIANSLDYEHRHKAIIDRFGCYPHRNAALGRASTAEELEFLEQPGSGF